MRFRFGLGLSLAAMTILAVACQGDPPITYVMEVTREVTRVVTTGADEINATSSGPLPLGTQLATPTPNGSTTQVAVSASTTPAATLASTATATLSVTSTPDVFPTAVVGQIYVAEQTFQNGRMYWLQPIDQIWVATTDKDGKQVWLAFENTFVDGQPEINPTLTPPAQFLQPIRGFGKLWRENAEVQALVGWAEKTEIGYVTRYEYRAGGSVSPQNEYVPGKGRHVITLLDGQMMAFDELDNTWRVSQSDS
jgi:hypothetical protein